jgi:hypothetical protein
MIQQKQFKHGLAAAALSAATVASAQSLYSAEATARANAIGFGNFVQPAPHELFQNSPVPLPGLVALREANVTNAAQGGLAGGMGTASASTETAGLHLMAVANASVISNEWTVPNPNASGGAVASALFRDVLSFDVAGAAPDAVYTVIALVRVDAQSMIDGTLGGAAAPSFLSGSSSWRSAVSMATSQGWLFEDDRRSDCSWNGQMTCTGNDPGVFQVGFSVTNLSRIVFQMSAIAEAHAGALLAGPGTVGMSSTLDMSHTLAWGGVLDVRDANGDAVSTYSLVGLGSGFDFRNAHVSAVPEPASAMMTLAGVLVLLGARRRRAGQGV